MYQSWRANDADPPQNLELIWNSHKAVKTYYLLDLIRPVNGAAKPATVYRALDFLLEQGLIHRVESLKRLRIAAARAPGTTNCY